VDRRTKLIREARIPSAPRIRDESPFDIGEIAQSCKPRFNRLYDVAAVKSLAGPHETTKIARVVIAAAQALKEHVRIEGILHLPQLQYGELP
jgi:hypothetical protein